MCPRAASRRAGGRSRVPRSSANPMTACSGVRSSWLSVDSSSDFARLASSATRAASSASRRAIRSRCAARSRGDVDDVEAHVAAAPGPHDRRGERRLHQLPVAADERHLERLGRHRARREASQQHAGPGPVLPAQHRVEVAARAAAAAGCPTIAGQRVVDLEEPSAEVGQRHPDGVVLERPAEPLLALRERAVEPVVLERDGGEVGEARDEPALALVGAVRVRRGRPRTCRARRRGPRIGLDQQDPSPCGSARVRNRSQRTSRAMSSATTASSRYAAVPHDPASAPIGIPSIAAE